jgi:hypothetical protein
MGSPYSSDFGKSAKVSERSYSPSICSNSMAPTFDAPIETRKATLARLLRGSLPGDLRST